MRNIVDWIREVLLAGLHAVVEIYEKTATADTCDSKPCLSSFKTQSQQDAVTCLPSNRSFVDETQSSNELGSQEVPETCSESIHESIESACVDPSISTQTFSSLVHVPEYAHEGKREGASER